ncbi:MAG: ribosome biosis GTPase Der [Rickettsiaceae bacterium]|jgi:GTP-binding protein|nr:ribosome biosis GTPase Der [Rickettsiaceae bacterium]
MSFKIAIVGRPNVGKSTIFNRLTGTRKAIVHDMPGVTRDRRYGEGRVSHLDFTIIDTPGLEEAENETLEYRMMKQTEAAIDEADLVMVTVDGRVGITPTDLFFANWVRKKGVNAFLLVNKCEKTFIPDRDYFKLGFKQIVPFSAEHGLGMAELYEAIASFMPEDSDEDIVELRDEDEDIISIAIVGRPNSGKSTFVNAIIGEDRLLTGPEAGITRDSVDLDFEYKEHKLKLVDTAGLRKKANIKIDLEKMSTGDTIRSLKMANIVIIMMDATCPFEAQDLNIASLAYEEGRALLIVINKIDLIEDPSLFSRQVEDSIDRILPQAKGIRVIYTSALKKKNINEVLDGCIAAYKKWNFRIKTYKLNEWLNFATESHPLPLQKHGKRVRVKYATQIKTRPPAFKLFCNTPELIPDSYKKYLLNSIREHFDMPGVPLRLDFVKPNNPYSKKS